MTEMSEKRIPLFCHGCGQVDDTHSACIENNETAQYSSCGEYLSTTHWADDPNWRGFERREESE